MHDFSYRDYKSMNVERLRFYLQSVRCTTSIGNADLDVRLNCLHTHLQEAIEQNGFPYGTYKEIQAKEG